MKPGFYHDPLTGFLNLFGLMKAVKEDRLGDQGAIAFLSMNKLTLTQHHLSLEEQLKDLGESLAAIAMELKSEGMELKVIPSRVFGDKLVLLFPGTTPKLAMDITERLRKECERRLAGGGLFSSSFSAEVTVYGQEEKKLTAFLRLLFVHFLPEADSKGDWLDGAEGLLTDLARHIAESYFLLDQAQYLALSDDVSGLPNHRAAQTVLGEKFNNSMKEQAPFSILFIDGDNLRQYNDISYQKGNSMIRNLGEILASQLRRGDFLARWFSGDEFLVVLPGADRREALHVGERLRVLVEETTKDWLFPITISVGMASFPDDGRTLEALLRKAEEANAFAKRSGKNQVCEAGVSYEKVDPNLCQQKTNCN